MPCLGSARLVFNSLKAPTSPRSLYSSFTGYISTTTRLVPCRAFPIMANSHDDLFDYTSGRWGFNDALRHAERRLVFDVEGLRRLAAQSVGRSPADVVNLSKLAEGGFNRTFLITLCDDFQMVARIPYPATVPKYYAVASEVATMELLRSSGLPVPQVYGYSPASDNAAKTEYIFMEFIRGTKLSDVWLELGESDIVSILRQLAQLESQMMSISFPAGGSLYYAHDLEKVAGRAAIPLKDERFCVGPDTRLPMWYGRRSQLDVDRRPYESAEAALVAAARKELACLEQFGQPLLPFRRERRDGYQYQEQSPSAHIENLKRYLLIASSLVPRDPALGHFCIRHPDLQQSDIVVRRSSDSGWQVVSLLDWQHASSCPYLSFPAYPNASRTTTILSRNL
ncbi:kinase-like domain-containing protein [Gloeopeniophorella convolvens]|nr:kinase-like domain-containing protein [Gloeopeniophorella convolvens]